MRKGRREGRGERDMALQAWPVCMRMPLKLRRLQRVVRLRKLQLAWQYLLKCLAWSLFSATHLRVVRTKNITGISRRTIKKQDCLLVTDTNAATQPYTFVCTNAAVFGQLLDFLNTVRVPTLWAHAFC